MQSNTNKKLDFNTRNTDKKNLFHTKHNFFKNCFFPSTAIEWNKLDFNFRSISSLGVFKENLLKSSLEHLQKAFLVVITVKESNTSYIMQQ